MNPTYRSYGRCFTHKEELKMRKADEKKQLVKAVYGPRNSKWK